MQHLTHPFYFLDLPVEQKPLLAKPCELYLILHADLYNTFAENYIVSLLHLFGHLLFEHVLPDS